VNVAVCSAGDLFGGVEKFILTFVAALERVSPHRAVVVLFAKGPLYEELRERGADVEVFDHPRYDPTVVYRLARFLKARRIDVVHAHGYKATLLAGTAARIAGARIVKTEHGALEPFASIDRIKMTINHGLDHWLSRYLVDRMVFVSHDIRRRNGRYYDGLPGEVIYNGVPRLPAVAFRKPPELDGPRFNLGIVGRLTPVKGHIYLLQAVSELPHLDLRLCILGDGELREELERFSREHDLTDRVSFLGFRRNADDYMRAMDALVMPSLHEGFPYTMLEAGYWGVPLIASRVGGICEVFTDRQDCLLVEPQDVPNLKDAIVALYSDTTLRQTIGERARRRVTTDFLVDAMVGKYVAAYDRSLGGSIQ
jgi:glycosyltransferase involved in cell wall biosynthesis